MSNEEWTAVDGAIEEVWEARRRLWERFDNDPVKYMEYMRQLHPRSCWLERGAAPGW